MKFMMKSSKDSVCITRPPMPMRMVVLACLALMNGTAFADSAPKDLLVSTSYYGGNTSTVTPGITVSGGVTASYDGSFPNVFQNNVADGSFGVTSGITLETFNTANDKQTGNVDISAAAAALGINLSTSFSSKSELSLNVSIDGTAATFMGYNSPISQLDVSNSNTAAVLDPTNLVTSTTPRAIGQINLSDGSLEVAPVNAYSGNNGRAAVLADGNYYMVGNAGNSSKKVSNGTLDALSANTGVQMFDPDTATVSGGAFNTTVVGQQVCPACVGTGTGNQYGYSLTQYGYAADKTGKDDNFRGLTVFDNTLYVTKGSGSNGINTVYQVGEAGALAHGGAIPGDAAITILPGFNTTNAKTATTGPNPFGIWFANPTTLYVADEGDGVVADAATSSFAGLEKWIFDGTKWNLAYTLQNGLNLGQNYTVTGGLNADGSINPNGTGYTYTTATDGLRNITGRVNENGTVTIYGVTSTVSTGTGDQGADPNILVSITDKLSFSTIAEAANESFTNLQTAAYGQVLRGVALVHADDWPKHGQIKPGNGQPQHGQEDSGKGQSQH
ncbi:MAG: hypothetical protein WA435_11295 [Gallionellaceae bacterium]